MLLSRNTRPNRYGLKCQIQLSIQKNPRPGRGLSLIHIFTAALPVYYAALAAFVLISPRLYLAANRASLRRGEEHLRAAPV